MTSLATDGLTAGMVEAIAFALTGPIPSPPLRVGLRHGSVYWSSTITTNRLEGITMSWIFSTTTKEARTKKKHMFLGVELELSYLAANLDGIKLPRTISRGCDSTIRPLPGHDGVELRFHPSTFAWWNSHRKRVTKFLNTLSLTGGKSDTKHNCGLHIHFDKTLSNEHLINFTHFVYSSPEYMLALSRRSENSSQAWAQLNIADFGGHYEATKGYRGECSCQSCLHVAYKRGSPGVTHSINGARERILDGKRWSKCEAVSIREETVELRLFAGTLNPSLFYAGLQFVSALIKFTTPETYNWELDCNIEKFKHWMDTPKRHKRYADLLVIMNNVEC